MLSDRRQRVLAALIEEYVLHALPVGSRTLVERHQLGVSPATVRNELYQLEEAGYIAQPHTSAGRVPTDFGYRRFVDDLLSDSRFDQLDEQASDAARQMRETALEIDHLIEQTTSALARLTECLSIVVPPSSFSLSVKQVSFVHLGPRRALVVAVTEDGQVHNRNVEFAEDVSVEDLAVAEAIARDVVAGRKVADLPSVVAGAQQKAHPVVGVMLGELMRCLEDGTYRFEQAGLATLVSKPEFSSSSALIPVLNMLEDDTVLMQIVAAGEGQPDTVVRIGHENNNESLSGVSVVASQYGRGDSKGVVAVIGPTRMDYAQVIGAVRMARTALQDC